MRVIPHHQPNRKSPWEARWYVNRQLKSRFFKTEKERDQFIRKFSKEIDAHGEEVFKFDKDRMRRWQEADYLVPDVDPITLAEFWLNHHSRDKALTLEEGFQRYLRQMERAGPTPEYQKHAKKAFERLIASFGDLNIDELTAEQVAEFIHGLPFEPITKRHYRTYLVTAYKWFIRQKWTTHNPAALMPVPKVNLPEPGILTVKETEALFRSNEKVDPEICGLLALGAFGGMRSSAIARLSYEELDFKAKAILTPASKTKKGRRQFIEGLPENLWAWLERTPKKAFKMTPRQIASRRAKAFERAGLLISRSKAAKDGVQPKAPQKNCLRHSFVSYHVALHRDPGKTALLVSHKDQAILWEHYLGVASKKDAEQYFGTRPS